MYVMIHALIFCLFLCDKNDIEIDNHQQQKESMDTHNLRGRSRGRAKPKSKARINIRGGGGRCRRRG